MPKINREYQRKHGDRGIVTVLDMKDGSVKIKDQNGVHFIKQKNFYQFFKEVTRNEN